MSAFLSHDRVLTHTSSVSMMLASSAARTAPPKDNKTVLLVYTTGRWVEYMWINSKL